MSSLSKELIVACEIYHFNFHLERIWFTKLCDSLKTHMSTNDISESLDTLSDWMIVEGNYGETEKGRAGYLYRVCENETNRIKYLYETYWMEVRGK